MCRRMLCRAVVDRLLDGNWQPHVEIDVGGGGGGEQAGDGGGEEALEEPGYSTCNMSMLKLVKKGPIDACHLKQPLGPGAPGKSQLVLTNLHDGLAIGPLWDAPTKARLNEVTGYKSGNWLYLSLGVGVHKAGSIEVHLNDRGFVVWNGKHGEMVFDINFWKLVEGTHLTLLQHGPHSGKTMDHFDNRGRLFTQNADGSISPTHAPHLVLGAKRPSANEMKTELLKEMSGLGLAVALCGRSAEQENACITHHS